MNSFTCLFVVAVFYAVSPPQCYAQETAVDRASTGEPGLASYIRGIASYGQAEYTEAERAFLETVRLVPEYTGARYWLGMTYFRQNRLDEAEAAFKSLTGTFSTYAKARDGLGLVYLKKPNHAFQALDAFQKVAALDPNDAEIYYHIGLTYQCLIAINHSERCTEVFD